STVSLARVQQRRLPSQRAGSSSAATPTLAGWLWLTGALGEWSRKKPSKSSERSRRPCFEVDCGMSATYRSKYEALVDAFPKRDRRLLACRVARWVLTEHRVEDPRLWEAVEVSERYADGLATRAELFSAQAAAWDAARAAARGAADAAWAAQ